MDELDKLTESIFNNESINENVINDWLWFDRDEILTELGIEK